MSNNDKRTLEDHPVPVKMKLSLLWASLMSLYIYNDYFSMYLPGTIEDMAAGQLGPLGDATQLVLVSVATILAIPALMIFMSAALPTTYSRWLNILMGLVYTIIEALTVFGSYLFYQVVVALEIIVTILIVYYAVRWPEQATNE